MYRRPQGVAHVVVLHAYLDGDVVHGGNRAGKAAAVVRVVEEAQPRNEIGQRLGARRAAGARRAVGAAHQSVRPGVGAEAEAVAVRVDDADLTPRGTV